MGLRERCWTGGEVGGREAVEVEVRWTEVERAAGRAFGRVLLAGGGEGQQLRQVQLFLVVLELQGPFFGKAWPRFCLWKGRDWPPAPLSLPVVPAVSQHSSRYILYCTY